MVQKSFVWMKGNRTPSRFVNNDPLMVIICPKPKIKNHGNVTCYSLNPLGQNYQFPMSVRLKNNHFVLG
jgi:hypothetical protein